MNKIFDDVVSIEELHKISYTQKYQTTVKDELIQKSLNALKNITGDNWIPVIFLHSEFDLKSKKTFLAIEQNTLASETFEWFEIQSNELVKLKKPLTSESLEKNNLYDVELDKSYNKEIDSKKSTF